MKVVPRRKVAELVGSIIARNKHSKDARSLSLLLRQVKELIMRAADVFRQVLRNIIFF